MLPLDNKLSEAERRYVNKWRLRVTAFYGAVICLLLIVVIVSHEVGRTGRGLEAERAGPPTAITGSVAPAAPATRQSPIAQSNGLAHERSN